MRRFRLFFIPLLIFSVNCNFLFSQVSRPDTLPPFKKIAAGSEYKASSFKRWLWGSNYRDIWTTPVTVKQLLFDTAKGGLKPIKAGGGNQTQNLHLQTVDGRQYSIRSVDKTLGKILPDAFRNTFLEHRVTDGISMSNPYGAAAIPLMAEKAKVYHTNPDYVYVSQQPALDTFNTVYGNNLYLFEQRVSGNWKDADNLGNFENYIETDALLDTLKNNNNSIIDQQAFIRARLFDMFINDWDRHEGQWRWGEEKQGDKTLYVPVPVDRDQAFSTHNGVALKTAVYATGLRYMQAFKDNLRDVKYFNYEERNLDRRLLNMVGLDEWQSVALDLQNLLTDKVIEEAIHQLPKEIYPLAGDEIIAKLKARRNHIAEWATEYYTFISNEVEIPGSGENEEFDVQHLDNREINVQVFALDENGAKKDVPRYSRTFKSSETKEIRLFGMDGYNKYVISGNTVNDIKIKIVGGLNTDSVINNSSTANDNKLTVYGKNNIKTTDPSRLHIVNDTFFRSYKYNWYNYDRKGVLLTAMYSNEDRLYVGLGYRMKLFAWGKEPFASRQLLDLHYSLLEHAFSITYKALFPNPVMRSDFSLLANYDAVRWVYFFGIGNDTKFTDHDKTYYTARTRQWIFQPQLSRSFGKSTVNVFLQMSGIKVIEDTARYITKAPDNSTGYNWQTFAGGGISYSYQHLNDPVVPVKGFFLNASAVEEQNFTEKSSHYFKYSGVAHVYVPLAPKFSLNLRAGASSVTGNPEFYQYASIGGTIFRGVVRDRFRGKTAFYNTNDIRFISPVHSYFFNGKAGFLAFFDNGRVWVPSEESNTWHTAYGFGVIVAPFNFLYADATYGRSKKENSIQVRLTYFTR